MKSFCANNSTLWQICTGTFSPEASQAYICNESLKKERNIVDSIFNQQIQFNENIKVDFMSCFGEAQKEIDNLILIDVKDEKERKINKSYKITKQN